MGMEATLLLVRYENLESTHDARNKNLQIMNVLLIVNHDFVPEWHGDNSYRSVSRQRLNMWRFSGFESVSKSFRTGLLERELQMVQLSATKCSCIVILWVSLVSSAAIILCFASQHVFIVYFVNGSVRKLLDTPSYVCLCVCVFVCLFVSRFRRFQLSSFPRRWLHTNKGRVYTKL
jgi:hypothetical protein